MKFGTHIVGVTEQLHAKFQLPTLALIRDFGIGSRVGEHLVIFVLHGLTTFFLTSPFTLKLIRFRWYTNLIQGAINHFLSQYCFDLKLGKKLPKKLEKVKKRSQTSRKAWCNLHIYIDADYNTDILSHLRVYFTPEVLKCHVKTCLKRMAISFC